MTAIFIEAEKHRGTSVVEVLQNCVIFSNKAHELITSRELKDENQMMIEHGKPLIFGAKNDKGIRLNGTSLEIVKIGENGITESDILVHNMHETDPGVHVMLSRMMPPEFPVALGVIRAVDFQTYNDEMDETIAHEKGTSKIKNVDDLLNSGGTWTIE